MNCKYETCVTYLDKDGNVQIFDIIINGEPFREREYSNRISDDDTVWVEFSLDETGLTTEQVNAARLFCQLCREEIDSAIIDIANREYNVSTPVITSIYLFKLRTNRPQIKLCA